MKSAGFLKEMLTVVALSSGLAIVYTAVFNPVSSRFPVPPGSGQTGSDTVSVTIEKVREYVRDGGGILIDGRHEAEYGQGHIGNAINVPVSEFERYAGRLDPVPKDATLICYCDGEGCSASTELAARLTVLGYQKVRIYYGGWQEWKRLGSGNDR